MTDHWLGDSRTVKKLRRSGRRRKKDDKKRTGKWQNYKLVNCQSKYRVSSEAVLCTLTSDDEFDIERLVKRFKRQQQQQWEIESTKFCDNVQLRRQEEKTLPLLAAEQHRKLLRTHFSHKLPCRKASQRLMMPPCDYCWWRKSAHQRTVVDGGQQQQQQNNCLITCKLQTNANFTYLIRHSLTLKTARMPMKDKSEQLATEKRVVLYFSSVMDIT